MKFFRSYNRTKAPTWFRVLTCAFAIFCSTVIFNEFCGSALAEADSVPPANATSAADVNSPDGAEGRLVASVVAPGPGMLLKVSPQPIVQTTEVFAPQSLLSEFGENFRKNLFKPLLLFFYMGFLIPILGVAFEFPYALYQALTIYLLIAIGWHGGEELATLTGASFANAVGFMFVGFVTNTVIGVTAYGILRAFIPKMRKVDCATVAAYYGSDSAGTFVTTVGVLATLHIAAAAFMPVMLAIMEIPGCLVGLFLISQLRNRGMDANGNMPEEPGYDPSAQRKQIGEIALEKESGERPSAMAAMKEVLLNPGLFLLFGGIIIGFVSRLQGAKVVAEDDHLFVHLFQGLLCLFLLEMGMTASKRLKDLRNAGWRYIAFGILAPNVFASVGILVAYAYSHLTGVPFELGTYVLFAVLCGASSYIAVPAIQRIAIPEASPTLPLAASLGLTFSYNVTIGIPVYIMFSEILLRTFP